MSEKETVFKRLNDLNVNPFIKQKKNMNYLSWAIAWRMVIDLYPEANYKLKTFDNGMPCKITSFGAFVSTEVTIEGITREMTLPVLDGANKSLKEQPYTYQVKEYVNKRATGKMIDKNVPAVTAFDVNKAQMRCLVKNLGVFGLGIDLYIGYDLPNDLQLEPEKEQRVATIKSITILAERKGILIDAICSGYNKNSLADFSNEELEKAQAQLNTKKDKE